LDGCGVRQSPTLVANEFNLRYWGRSITPHTARNWLLGKSIPTQDKLRVLADWLQVSPDELRFGRALGLTKGAASLADLNTLNMTDREMLSRYLALSVDARNTVRDVVTALSVAATVKPKG
jgi:transcriptional regulator with XRE-family HTH domain